MRSKTTSSAQQGRRTDMYTNDDAYYGSAVETRGGPAKQSARIIQRRKVGNRGPYAKSKGRNYLELEKYRADLFSMNL